jgi:hypothetical protein
MVLVIFLTNVLIRKREMMKVTQKANKHIKEKEPQRKFSRKTYAPKKTSHHQMRMNSVTMLHIILVTPMIHGQTCVHFPKKILSS